MTIAKPRTIQMPGVPSLLEAARAYFQTPVVTDAPASWPSPVIKGADKADVQTHYAELLETELDRQHLTTTEREDFEMLDRVRMALYAD